MQQKEASPAIHFLRYTLPPRAHPCRFYLIMRMVYMFVFHGVEEDIRSDNGGEEEDAATAANGHGKLDAGNGIPPPAHGGRGGIGNGKSKTN